MEFLAVLFLGFFLFLIVGGVMGFVANSRIKKLERQILLLRRDVLNLQNDGMVSQSNEANTRSQAKPDKPKQPRVKTEDHVSTAKPVNEAEPILAAATAPPPTNLGPHTTRRGRPDEALSKGRNPIKKDTSFEFELGAKWTVWVGGLALLLGAVFLLRYSIEAGFCTPAMRVGMAAVMGLVLLGAGEWLRRGDNLPKNKAGGKIELFENSYIPGILTAVGVFTLLGTVFAAFELYDFIGANTAFILMGLISLGGLALGLIHGPWISALGLAAAFATPILIKSEDPSFSGLFLYLFVISLAAFALARLRDWGWLVIAACLGSIFWLFYTIDYAHSGQNFYIWMTYFTLVLGVNFYLARDRQLLPANPHKPFVNHNGESAFIMSALLAFAYFWLSLDATPVETKKIFIGAGLTAALAVFPIYKKFASAHLWIAGLFALSFQYTFKYGSFILACILAAILILAGLIYCVRNLRADDKSGRLETFSLYAPALIPPVIVATATEYGGNISDNIISFMIIGIAVILGTIAFILKSKSRPAAWITAFLWGSAFAYVAALLIPFDKPLLNAALAAGIAIYACAFKFFKFDTARWISLTLGLLAVGTTLMFSIGDQGAIGSTPILNEIWIYFALPAALSLWSGLEFRRTRSDVASEGLIALAIAATGLFFIYQIRHYIHDGMVHKSDLTFDELGLYVATGLAFTIGRKFTKNSILNTVKDGALSLLPVIFLSLSWVTIGIFLLLICLFFAPLFNDTISVKGGTYLNSLTLAYLLPCTMMGFLIWMMRAEKPDPYSNTVRIAGLIGMMIFVTSQIRVFFSGERIALTHKFPEGWETYAITASWLFIGVVALAIGIRYNRKAFRVGSGIIIFLTVLKAFLADMATLEGVLRAISFVILGVVLIIIGRVYQKLLFNQKASAETA